MRTDVGLVPCYVGTLLMAASRITALDLPELTAVIAGLLVRLAGTATWQYGYTLRTARKYLPTS